MWSSPASGAAAFPHLRERRRLIGRLAGGRLSGGLTRGWDERLSFFRCGSAGKWPVAHQDAISCFGVTMR